MVTFHFLQLTVATTCISKGEEITHIYQGHFGDTPKEERQRILKNMFHFECHCIPCVNNYPLASELPDSYFPIPIYYSPFPNNDSLKSYLQKIKNKLEHFNYDSSTSKSKPNFLEVSKKIKKIIRNVAEEKKITAIFKTLEEYHEEVNKEVMLLIENKNIDEALKFYYERSRIACVFLNPPHMIFLNGRGAITDGLWVKYGNKSYGASKTDLNGT
jgi:hypothetical protein